MLVQLWGVKMKTLATCLGVMLAWASATAAPQHAPVENSARQTSAQDVQRGLGANAHMLVIDVRSPQEFATGHIPGAVNIPAGELAAKLQAMKLAKGTTLVTTCEHGGRSSRAALELQKLGYKTASYCTLDAWKKCGYKIQSGNAQPHS